MYLAAPAPAARKAPDLSKRLRGVRGCAFLQAASEHIRVVTCVLYCMARKVRGRAAEGQFSREDNCAKPPHIYIYIHIMVLVYWCLEVTLVKRLCFGSSWHLSLTPVSLVLLGILALNLAVLSAFQRRGLSATYCNTLLQLMGSQPASTRQQVHLECWLA